MCQRLRDILFPTNILGKDKRTIKFALPEGVSSVSFGVKWQGGDGSDCTLSFTRKTSVEGVYEVWKDRHIIQPVYQTWFIEMDTRPFIGNCVYLKCTNVTSLIVNGETLI